MYGVGNTIIFSEFEVSEDHSGPGLWDNERQPRAGKSYLEE